jgi:hypothetical protein
LEKLIRRDCARVEATTRRLFTIGAIDFSIGIFTYFNCDKFSLRRSVMNTYVIQWKSKLNGRAGKGTKLFDREDAERLAEELNSEHPQIEHEAVQVPTQGAAQVPPESPEQVEPESVVPAQPEHMVQPQPESVQQAHPESMDQSQPESAETQPPPPIPDPILSST